MSGVRIDCYHYRGDYYCSCFEHGSRFMFKGRIIGFLAGDYFVSDNSCDCILFQETSDGLLVVLVELKDLSQTTSKGIGELFGSIDPIIGKFKNCEKYARDLLENAGLRGYVFSRFLVLKLPEDSTALGALWDRLRVLARNIRIVASPGHIGSGSLV